jgi:type I restriction enzyme S subunit
MTPDSKRPLPKGWRWVRLGEVCEINPRRPAGLKFSDVKPTSFVPMSAVDDRQGIIARPEIRPYVQVRKGYTYFAEGDVLFAKITPCMQNGKHAIARGLTSGTGFGSTEFHVIRPGPEIAAEWVWHYVRQPRVLTDATRYFTGAVGQQRVPAEFLARLTIPLPPLSEQKRIAAILKEQLAAVARARAAAEARLDAINALPAALLCRAFNGEL